MSDYSDYLLANYGSGLLSYYRLKDTTSPWVDSSGNGRNITPSGLYTLSQPSLLPNDKGSTSEGCVLFRGGYGSYTGDSGYSSLTSFTIAGWVQSRLPSSAGNPGYIFGGQNRWGLWIANWASALYPASQAQTTGNPSSGAYSSDSVVGNVPAFVVAVYDGAHITNYVDGIFIVQTAKTGTIGLTVACGLGCRGASTYPFKGYLQHIGFWNRALSLDNIRDLYVRGVQGAYPGPVGATFKSFVYPWSTPVLLANPDRKRVVFTNNSDAIMSLELGSSGAVAGSGIILPPSGGRAIIDTYTGPISAVHGWAQGYKALAIQEE
jgi:Concanavalin A-like lectin/glucanases superfamily